MLNHQVLCKRLLDSVAITIFINCTIDSDDYPLIIYFYTDKLNIKDSFTINIGSKKRNLCQYDYIFHIVMINNIRLSETMTLIWTSIILFPYISIASNLVTLYQRTENISSSSWDSATKSTKNGIRNVIDCAGKCQIRQSKTGKYFKISDQNETKSSNCKSYKLNLFICYQEIVMLSSLTMNQIFVQWV